MTHFLLLVAFSAAVGAVLGVSMRARLRDGLRLGAAITGGMVLVALVLAWLLYLLGS